jgi:hypothetical protein
LAFLDPLARGSKIFPGRAAQPGLLSLKEYAMKILSIIFPIALLFYSCTVTSPAEPSPVECIDYSGNAIPSLSASSFSAVLVPGYNFDGDLSGNFSQTDSGRILTAVLTGTFKPSLGDRTKEFTKTGSLLMRGVFTEANGEYAVRLWAVVGTEGLEGTTGDLDLNWPVNDDTIYYVGTFCMLPNPE